MVSHKIVSNNDVVTALVYMANNRVAPAPVNYGPSRLDCRHFS